MNSKNFKGQSMVEYLTTYGWAVFVLVLVIGILMYGGFFRSDFFINEKCELGSNIPCKAVVFNDKTAKQTKITAEILNGFSYAIEITSLNVSTAEGLQFDFNQNLPQKVESGEKFDFIGTLKGGRQLDDNALKQFTISVTYKSCAPELGEDCSGDPHVINGRIIAKVVPSD